MARLRVGAVERSQRRRGHRSGRVALGLAVTFVVLIGLLVGADRVAARAAENTIAEKVSQQTDRLGVSSDSPEVTVQGFPFLTQVVAGRYQEITIVLRRVSAEGVVLPLLDIHARGVEAEMGALISGDGEVVAETITGTATIGYESVRAVVDQPGLELGEEGGRLRLRLPVVAAGQRHTAVGVADIVVNEGRIRISVADLRVEGVTLPAAAQRVLDDYKRRLSIDVKIPPLPFNLTVNAARVLPEGVAVTATASGVPITS